MTYTEQYLSETAEIASKIDAEAIEAMVKELISLREHNGRLFVLGLGGSAANASHAVNDFRKLCGIEAYAPTDNVAELTARMNDEGTKHIFDSYITSMKENDAVMVLSVGGGVFDVSYAISWAVRMCDNLGFKILGIVGRDGGETKQRGDCVLIIPTVESSRVTPHTEGWQSVILHCLVSHPDLQREHTKW